MEHVQYQLEEKMGDGKWSGVYESKEEADYESPSYVSFKTADLARKYAAESGRWSPDAIKREVVRVMVVTTTRAILPESLPAKAKDGSRHYHAKDALLALDYPEQFYGMQLFLTDDGRKRGLWVWLEEDARLRVEADSKIYQQGLKDLVAHCKKKKFNFAEGLTTEQAFDFTFSIKLYFDYFFGHRTEASAIRLSWKQVKKLSAALDDAEHKREKNKTDEDY